jgi:hypothetical protein
MVLRSLKTERERGPLQGERAAISAVRKSARRRTGGDARIFGRLKRAIRDDERRSGDGREIGGTGATILRFRPAPLVRLIEKQRIGTEEIRAADDITTAFHAQAGAVSQRAQHGDPTLEILVAAVIDERALYSIEADVGIRHGMAARVVIAALRDYAARAGWTDRNIGEAWIKEAEAIFVLRQQPNV